MSKVKNSNIFKSSGVGTCILALVFMLSLLIIACNGGDGDGDSGDTLPAAPLTADSSDEAIGGVQESVNTDALTPIMEGMYSASNPIGVTLQPQAIGCESGSITDKWHLAEGYLEVIYDNCVIEDSNRDGTLRISLDLSGYDAEQETGTIVPTEITTTNFVWNYGSYNLTFSGNDYSDQFSMQMENFAPIYSSTAVPMADISEETITVFLNGKISGEIEGSPHETEFYDYEIATRNLNEFSPGAVVNISVMGEMELNGHVKPQCMDGWLDISTDPESPLLVPYIGACPEGGELTITAGANSVKIIFDYEEMTGPYSSVSYNGGEPQTLTCEEIPKSACPLIR